MTGPVSLKVRYRPLRIGWCVEDSLENFSTAVALSHVFWGGRFNPIVPCADRILAEDLISAFNVDALFNVSGTPAIDAFIKEFPNIQWPEFHSGLFVENFSNREPTLLDVSHPARHLFESHVDRREKPTIDAALYEWDAADPLRHSLQATCGTYPPESVTGRDYAGLFRRAFASPPTVIAADRPLPVDLFRKVTPNHLTTVDLDAVPARFSNWLEPGFYYGDASDFTDLVNFWNLRACNIELYFYDPSCAERLRPFVEAYSGMLHERPRRHQSSIELNLWQKDRDLSHDLGVFGSGLSICTFHAGLFNGLNLNPPVMAFSDQSVLAVSTDDALGTSATFQLPEKPFFSDIELSSQMTVVSVSAPNIGNAMLTPPFIPQLNEYYGGASFQFKKARAEQGSIGIIQNVTADQLTLRALPFNDILAQMFKAFGMKATPSPAGLVSARLIEQMGGPQGCRVFKIAGVRKLIKKYSPTESFERTEALTMIGDNDPVTHQPRFGAYHSLYIEPRGGRKDLKPEDAFLYLLKKGVFRAGLKHRCPTCQLDFWVILDEAKSSTHCPYCGFEFNVLPQLRDRNWAFRRSGLFGREDSQQGGIPVAVTLQQLETMFHGRRYVYAVGMNLSSDFAAIENCETDLVFLVPSLWHSDQPLELAIAECKDAGGEITDEDVRKLTKVAQALEKSPCRVFVLFSKCGRFTTEEVERCKAARRRLFEQGGEIHYAYNVIMLSERELEPYYVYQETEKEFVVNPHANSLEDLAINTANIFFEPMPKPAP